MKTLSKLLILVPNSPILFPLIIYVYILTLVNTPLIDKEMSDHEDDADSIFNIVISIYPKSAMIFTSVLFYLTIIYQFILKNNVLQHI